METKVMQIKSNRQKRQEKYTDISKIVKCTPKQVRNRAQGKSGNRKITALGERIDVMLELYDEEKGEMLRRLKTRLRTVNI